jgi:lipoprotein NlpI
MRTIRRLCALAFLGLFAALAAEPPIPAEERSRMSAEFADRAVALTRAIAENPRSVALHSQRGDCHLFLGRFAEAVADFEKMIALDPAQDAPHWRLGIAYYFAGEFAKSARQFEKYHDYDGRDRENGIWKLLGDVKVHGLERARRDMLVYPRFDREPFPTLYAMFAGKKTTAEFLADLKERKLADNPQVMFFANYYAGLNEELLGRHEQALTLLRAAVANTWGRTAENGPAYMWQMARLHYESLSNARR